MAMNDNPAALKKQRATIKLEERKQRLDQYWSDYNLVQFKLELNDDSEAQDRVTFEEAFYNLSGKLRELLASPSFRNTGTTSRPASRFHEVSESSPHVRLPKLNLPVFSGRYDEWFPFCDTFVSIIHANPALGNIQRFQYLRASLTGDASNIIQSLEISDANYEVAWKLLKQRYDNKRVIVQNHVKAIMELPSMAKENHSELRQIADGAAKHLHALQALKRPTDQWDDILIHILSSKLDPRTLREWQSSLTSSELPTVKQFFEFVNHQCQTLEVTGKSSDTVNKTVNSRSQLTSKRQSSCAATVKPKCNYCQGEHSIYYCKEFLALPVSRRIQEMRSRKLCVNCLRSTSHSSVKCPSGQCKVCKSKHNSLLHLETSSEASQQATAKNEEQNPIVPSSAVTAHSSSHATANNVILSTAVVFAFDKQGVPKPCRVLLDCGSQANFISRAFFDTLGLTPRSVNLSISGVNGTATTSTRVSQIRLQSRISPYTASIDCVVADRVTDRIPAFSMKRTSFDIPRNIKLADPQFHVSSDIDLLIGAELFWDILSMGQVRLSSRQLILQKTRLGWILAGRLGISAPSISRMQSYHSSITNSQLHDQITRFWEIEDNSNSSSKHTLEESVCEQHFLSNVSQTREGRYVVKLPVKKHLINELRNSEVIALKRFNALERRFGRDPELKTRYTQFIDEYLSLGHMRPIAPHPDEHSASFYLPHHCVFKTSNSVTKLRVVFDASCKTDAGVSLNDALMVGPLVQQDLISILI